MFKFECLKLALPQTGPGYPSPVCQRPLKLVISFKRLLGLNVKQIIFVRNANFVDFV